ASKRTAHPWTAVLFGGFETGDRSALLVPDDTLFNTLGVNWPWRGKRRLTPTEFALQLPAIQRAVLRSPSVLALGVEAAARTRGVDPERIVVVGASLGVPTALAALRLTSIPKALVLLDGGADLELMMRAGLEHEGWLSAAAAITAAGAYQWVWPLEPVLNAPAAAQVPGLVMNSTDDERVPPAAALHSAKGLSPKHLHVVPKRGTAPAPCGPRGAFREGRRGRGCKSRRVGSTFRLPVAGGRNLGSARIRTQAVDHRGGNREAHPDGTRPCHPDDHDRRNRGGQHRDAARAQAGGEPARAYPPGRAK